jgi:hypothetical protein
MSNRIPCINCGSYQTITEELESYLHIHVCMYCGCLDFDLQPEGLSLEQVFQAGLLGGRFEATLEQLLDTRPVKPSIFQATKRANKKPR